MKDLSKENSIYFSDAELTQAACAVRDALTASLPDNDEIDHQFSAGFVSGMNILIRKNRAKNTFRKIMQSAAMILLSLLIGSGIWLATDTDAMADFSRWVRSVYENNFLYDFFGDMSSKPLPTLEFAWLPDGYTLAASEIDEEGGALLFSSEDGEDIVFGYGFMYSGKSFFVFGDNLVDVLANTTKPDGRKKHSQILRRLLA